MAKGIKKGQEELMGDCTFLLDLKSKRRVSWIAAVITDSGIPLSTYC